MRPHVVGEAGDRDAAVIVPHAGDQRRHEDGGIRRPVPVVAAVQRAHRAVGRELEAHHPARAEHDLLAPALMHGAVAEDPRVGAQQVRVRLEHAAQVRGPRFLLALEEELEVDRRRDPRGAQRIERAEHRDDRALVVARGTRVDARLAVDALPRERCRDDLRSRGERSVAEHRRERRARPLRWVDRLAIVVRVEHDGARGAGRAELAVHSGRPAVALEGARAHAAAAKQLDHGRGISANVHAVRRHVRYREQLGELARDVRFVRLAVFPRRGASRRALDGATCRRRRLLSGRLSDRPQGNDQCRVRGAERMRLLGTTTSSPHALFQ